MTAKTCSFADFDSRITVFDGSCAELICRDGSSEGCAGDSVLPATVSWLSTLGTEYLILVHAFSSGSGTGNFVLTITSSTPPAPPGNDECVDATPFVIGSTANGTTIFATLDDTGSVSCGNAATPSPGVWFSVVVSRGRPRLNRNY